MIKLKLPSKKNMWVDGLTAYRIYRSLKVMYSKRNYSIVKDNGDWSLIQTKQSTFDKMRTRFVYERLAKKYNLGDLIGIMVINFCSNPESWGGDFGTDAYDHYFKTVAKYDRMRLIFKTELTDVLRRTRSKGLTFRDVLNNNDKEMILFKFLQQGILSYESFILLDNLFNIIEKYDRINDHVWCNGYANRIFAYKRMLDIDREKLIQSFKSIIEDYKDANDLN